ncbi:MAG: DUF1080 domain-containing protein [Planctomycetia bacterium]|nr:DUF1080 domain-containing protein [Planctomycetia bacterium]
MKKLLIIASVLLFCCMMINRSMAHDLKIPQNENESYGYLDSPKQPWSEFRVHEPDRTPYPEKIGVVPLETFPVPPADAKILFDGSNLDQWKETQWKIVDGTVECTTGALRTKDEFGDYQFHLEWKSPANFEGDWGNQGNNGLLLMGVYEIQIFDSYSIRTYADGMAGSIYGQTPPLVNASVPPGNWQSYDVFFKAPVYDGENLVEPPRVTILQNGILVQNNQVIYGATTHFNLPGPHPKSEKGPIVLSGHGCPVQFRNIWIRESK